MNETAVVIIDVQRDFLDPTCIAGVGSWKKLFCIPGVQALLDIARKNAWQVFHVGTRHKDASTLPRHLQRHNVTVYCVDGTPGVDFLIEPVEGDYILYKELYSAFEGTGLKDKLYGVSSVLFAGVAADCCIFQSVFDADRLGFHPFVVLQAVSASSVDAFAASLASIGKSAGDVLDISGVETGEWLPLLPEQISPAAREWFLRQEAVLFELEEEALKSVLQRLMLSAPR